MLESVLRVRAGYAAPFRERIKPGGGKMAKRWRRRMGVMILCSMAGTTLMLALQGRIREAVPLHLCSVSALAAAALAFSPAPFVVDFLWLLGMPGAVLALVFPAPAVSRWQTAFTACYVLTHALIVLIGLSALAMGERPHVGRCCRRCAGLAGAGRCGVFCQPRARNGFSVSGRAAGQNAAGGNLSPELRRIYCVFAGNDGAACLGHGCRGKAAFRQG